jgi:hypothetical protein
LLGSFRSFFSDGFSSFSHSLLSQDVRPEHTREGLLRHEIGFVSQFHFCPARRAGDSPRVNWVCLEIFDFQKATGSEHSWADVEC